jgi:hypothetical protein
VETCGCARNHVTRHSTSSIARPWDASVQSNSWEACGALAGRSIETDVGGSIGGPRRTRGVCEESVRTNFSTPIPSSFAVKSHHSTSFCSSRSLEGRSSPLQNFLLDEFITGTQLTITELFAGRIRHRVVAHHPRTFLLVEFAKGSQLTITGLLPLEFG